MVDIIRQRSVTTTNTLNKWPSNGLYTPSHSLDSLDYSNYVIKILNSSFNSILINKSFVGFNEAVTL